FLSRHRTPRDLHSFPTRRSSDLVLGEIDKTRIRFFIFSYIQAFEKLDPILYAMVSRKTISTPFLVPLRRSGAWKRYGFWPSLGSEKIHIIVKVDRAA